MTNLRPFFTFFPHLPPQLDDTAQNPDQNVSIDTPLMGLVYDDDRIFAQQKIGGQFP